MATLVKELSGQRDFIAVVGDRAAPETRRRLEDAGARVETVRGLQRRPTAGTLRSLLRTIEEAEAEIVHVNVTDQGDSLLSLLATRLARKPSVATLHVVVPGRARWREALSAAALRQPNRVIAVSETVGRYLRAAGADAVVIRNGIPEPKPLPDARQQLGADSDAFVVGGVGRLHHQKGWDVLCHAASSIRERVPQADVVVIGEGGERARLNEIPACADVRFLGYRESASSLIPGFDVLVVPSRYEGFGLVAVEAMLMGVPVVASDTDSLPEVVGDCGILVAPGDPALLADAVASLAEARTVRTSLARRAQERARRMFSVERMAAETAALYDTVGA